MKRFTTLIAVFLGGVLTGTALMNGVALLAMRGAVRNYVAERRADEERAAAAAKCSGSGPTSEVMHRWYVAHEPEALRAHGATSSPILAPFAMALLDAYARDLDKGKASKIADAVSLAKFSDALDRAGQPAAAEQIRSKVSSNSGVDRAGVLKVAEVQLEAECRAIGARN